MARFRKYRRRRLSGLRGRRRSYGRRSYRRRYNNKRRYRRKKIFRGKRSKSTDFVRVTSKVSNQITTTSSVGVNQRFQCTLADVVAFNPYIASLTNFYKYYRITKWTFRLRGPGTPVAQLGVNTNQEITGDYGTRLFFTTDPDYPDDVDELCQSKYGRRHREGSSVVRSFVPRYESLAWQNTNPTALPVLGNVGTWIPVESDEVIYQGYQIIMNANTQEYSYEIWDEITVEFKTYRVK